MLVNTSPPRSIRRVISRSWELEKDSISTASMLETVVDDTDMKIRSRSMGLDTMLVAMGRAFRIKKPKTEMDPKYMSCSQNGCTWKSKRW
jgi:hypothetical protein